jgi:hypothetical protein
MSDTIYENGQRGKLGECVVKLLKSSQCLYSPQNREELFNLRHAQARNIIERIFGVIKKRWRILITPPAYDMGIQARIPAALAALHNFILEHDPEDRVDPEVWDPSPGGMIDPDIVAELRLQGELATERHTSEESEAGARLRDHIADKMWVQYEEILRERQDQLESDEEEEDPQSDDGAQSAMEDPQSDNSDDEMQID